MEIDYISKKLEKELTNPKTMKKKYGDIFEKLKNRLAVLRQAKSVEDISFMPPTRRHMLQGAKNRFAIDINRNYRLIFEVDIKVDEPLKVNKIKIIEIKDYHKQ